jgi:hypothetical protein
VGRAPSPAAVGFDLEVDLDVEVPQNRVGRTLLSAAFDFDLVFDLGLSVR